MRLLPLLVAGAAAELAKRAQYFSAPISMLNGLPVTNATVGGETLYLVASTSSGDTIVITECETSTCSGYGVYSAGDSSSFYLSLTSSSTYYIDSNSTSGYFGYDEVSLLGTTTNTLLFVSLGAPQYNVLGLGVPMHLVVSLSGATGSSFASYLVKLVSAGAADRMVYSMYMTLESGNGAVLFGAVDSSKYREPLVGLDLVEVDGKISSFAVNMLRVSVGGSDVTDGTTVVEFKLGQRYSTLPSSVVEGLQSALGWGSDTSGDCTSVSSTSFLLVFSNLVVEVPAAAVVSQLGNTCSLTLALSDSYALGADILMYLYVVYDIDYQTVALAAIDTTKKGSDIVAVTTTTIPGVQATSTTATATAKTTSKTTAKTTQAADGTEVATTYATLVVTAWNTDIATLWVTLVQTVVITLATTTKTNLITTSLATVNTQTNTAVRTTTVYIGGDSLDTEEATETTEEATGTTTPTGTDSTTITIGVLGTTASATPATQATDSLTTLTTTWTVSNGQGTITNGQVLQTTITLAATAATADAATTAATSSVLLATITQKQTTITIVVATADTETGSTTVYTVTATGASLLLTTYTITGIGTTNAAVTTGRARSTSTATVTSEDLGSRTLFGSFALLALCVVGLV